MGGKEGDGGDVEGKEGLEREKGGGEGKGGTERCLQHPMPMYRQHGAPPGPGMGTQRKVTTSLGVPKGSPQLSAAPNYHIALSP